MNTLMNKAYRAALLATVCSVISPFAATAAFAADPPAPSVIEGETDFAEAVLKDGVTTGPSVLQSAAAADPRKPVTPIFGPSIDDYAASDGQTTCPEGVRPGPLALEALLDQTYGDHTGYFLRACDVGGRSEHKEGRALDYMLNVNDADQKAVAESILNWLLATDRYGNKHANARRLGIMYLIWNRQIWHASEASAGWQPYSGESAHTDHIHFSFSWAGARKETTWWTAARPASSHDFDGDGDADLFTRNASTKALWLYKGAGNGSFEFGEQKEVWVGWGGYDIVVAPGDFDGDGDPDLIARNSTTKALWLYKGDGNGSFEFGEQKEIWAGWGGYDMIIAPGDFDGDGDPDLIARNSTTKAIWLYKGDGKGSFEFGEQKELWAGWGGYDMIIAPGDFDGDGDPDLIARNATTKAIWLYKGDGKGSFEFGEQKELWAGWGGYDMIIAPGDFDGDGDPDLIARNSTTKAIWLYKGDGNGSFEFGEQKELWAGWGVFDLIV
ncbi:FG-GAP repeat domain-containing protein [Actinoplanes lobatus]|uniref:ARB-07466-like C-terminal domain-containing protein n=1 Tax=Actinoplanes lobatus TaxID=113568 RepID=A0A7W7MHE9_9ACTN|nr:VCBS repeat-containing protein [Actinoplanes lobatus]MBB4749880.1 hypothetical protein [Actinoplanes lobatus]